MGKCLFLSILLMLLSQCTTVPNRDNLPNFTYMDGLRTEKRINCASRKPMDCMACALQGEAANQPAQGIYAVGVTIMTRAKGQLERICRVTKARRQFEGMRRRGKRKISRKVWGVTKHIIESKEVGWTHFWAPRTQAKLKRRKPHWAYSFEKRQCTKEKIGDHIFFNTNQCRLDRYMRVNAQNSSGKKPGG